MDQQQITTQRVNGWAAAGGLVVALAVGLITGGYAGFLGFALSGESLENMTPALLPMMTFATAAPAILLGGIWLMSRRAAPDFAKGVLIGGAIAVLASGVCSALMTQ